VELEGGYGGGVKLKVVDELAGGEVPQLRGEIATGGETLMTPSSEPETTHLPSGLKRMRVTPLPWPR
jgi:hypothetical protein